VLKEELIAAQQLARNEEGRILVWTGGADVPPSSQRPCRGLPRLDGQQLTLGIPI
jgi:hypothetical protein